MNIFTLLSCAAVLIVSNLSVAADLPEALHQALQLEIRDAGLLADKVTPEIIPNQEEESFKALVGTFMFYMSQKEGVIMRGNALESAQFRTANDEQKAKMRKVLYDGIDYSQAIVFAPQGPVCHTLTVFVDASCEFCAKFHQEVPNLNQAGIMVRYLAYPKDGLESEGAKLTETVWCNQDPAATMVKVWQGEKLPMQSCTTAPLMSHFSLGESLDFPGTPAILYANGELSTGVFTTKELTDYLNTLPTSCK